MRYHWLRDKETQKQIKIYWKKGKDEADSNKADYQTKHYYTVYHRGIRPNYVLDKHMIT